MEALAFEAQHLARGRSGRDRQHDGTTGGGHLYLATDHRLFERDGQVDQHIITFAPEAPIRADGDGDNRIARAARPVFTLTGQPDLGALFQPIGQLHIDGFAVAQGETLRMEQHRVLERDREAIGDIIAFGGLALLLLADQQTLVQANKLYARWSSDVPVVVLARQTGTQKRWVVLAVPAAADVERARQRLSAGQSLAVTVNTWAQWQQALGGVDLPRSGTAVAAPLPSALPVAAPGPTTATQPVPVQSVAPRMPQPALAAAPVSSPAPLLSAVPLAAPAPVAAPSPAPRGAMASINLNPAGLASAANMKASVVVTSPAGAASTAPAPRARQASDEAETNSEAPQLSRTESERLPALGPVSTAAKAIDVDFQAIEKSLGRGDHQGALEAVTKLEKYIGENWRTQYLSGVALMGLGRWDAAITALGKAQTLNPRHAMAALYLSVALQERGDHARAIQVLDKAQQLQPLSPELWLNQAHSYQALGQKAEARKAYIRFLDLSANRPDLAPQRTWVQNRLQKDNG